MIPIPLHVSRLRERGYNQTLELAKRRAEWRIPELKLPPGGYARLYIEHVQQADQGADLDFLVGCRGHDVARESH